MAENGTARGVASGAGTAAPGPSAAAPCPNPGCVRPAAWKPGPVRSARGSRGPCGIQESPAPPEQGVLKPRGPLLHRAENFPTGSLRFPQPCGIISISLCFPSGLGQGTNRFDFALVLCKGSRLRQLPPRAARKGELAQALLCSLPPGQGLFPSLLMDGVTGRESHHFVLLGICDSGFPT